MIKKKVIQSVKIVKVSQIKREGEEEKNEAATERYTGSVVRGTTCSPQGWSARSTCRQTLPLTTCGWSHFIPRA